MLSQRQETTLLVPRMKFDLTRELPEIEGRHLIATNATRATDLFLLSAVQNTRFEMNEKGVELRGGICGIWLFRKISRLRCTR